jgi:hypothetical protein
MFKYKVSHQLTEETKDLMNRMFLFKVISLFELIGFSLLVSFFIITFLHPKPNFFIVWIPVALFISPLYYFLEKTKT